MCKSNYAPKYDDLIERLLEELIATFRTTGWHLSTARFCQQKNSSLCCFCHSRNFLRRFSRFLSLAVIRETFSSRWWDSANSSRQTSFWRPRPTNWTVCGGKRSHNSLKSISMSLGERRPAVWEEAKRPWGRMIWIKLKYEMLQKGPSLFPPGWASHKQPRWRQITNADGEPCAGGSQSGDSEESWGRGPVDGEYKSSDCSAEEAQPSKKAKRGSSVLTWTPIKIYKHVQWKETLSPDWLLSSLGPLPLAPQSDSNVVFFLFVFPQFFPLKELDIK